ncbi:enoyl-CoA hydratase/isomerase family protein [Croceicoccus mobilis]|uniref:3-hydroxyisobutyryl-CoA hydrolase n=1 Tax=Croceicoccus mobilis TaxID=1703339 RepID=A0A916Z5P3_9SPHN|nr:enoyl-CoA hydratase/isomerase family protein [Croceicoccus mobilis]GGD77294.1 enoyl-CoA hydratase [Croceicoccus mobilis]
MNDQQAEHEVGAEIRGRLGILTLNRPKALNAVNRAMVERLDTILTNWAHDSDVDAVMLRSVSERAFCAGGDVRTIGAPADPKERMALGRAFFGTEYGVNYRINSYPKPFISLINGIAMGGGLGLSMHGSHRVVSEDLRLAMPEAILGLFPDVGATWFLNRCQGAVGRYLALIGPHLGAADALAVGLATHHVLKANFDALMDALAKEPLIDASVVETTLNRHSATLPAGNLAPQIDQINEIFGNDDLDAVVAQLRTEASTAGWIAEACSVVERASPTSLRATWRRIVEGRGQTIERVLADDFRMAVRIVGGHDFAEGVRAILIDKDQSPSWQPANIADVSRSDIDALLAPFEGSAELTPSSSQANG